MVRTLLHRAEQLVTDPEDRAQEIHHVKDALKANGYSTWAMTIPDSKKKDKQDKNSNTEGGKIPPMALPYIKGTSEKLARIFSTYGVAVYHKPFNSIRSQLVKPKDRTATEKQCGVVYHIKCNDCDNTYVGETARSLGTRMKEHQSRSVNNSAVKEHCHNAGHSFTMENVKILGKESHDIKRKVKEAIQIKRKKPSLNRDGGLELPPVYHHLFSRELPNLARSEA